MTITPRFTTDKADALVSKLESVMPDIRARAARTLIQVDNQAIKPVSKGVEECTLAKSS